MTTEELLQRMQTAREQLLKASDALVKGAQALGEPPVSGQCEEFDLAPGESEDDECGMCRCGYPRGDHEALTARYPCSPTCTHEDASNPGHPERVKERSEALVMEADSYASGAEAMRAACLTAILEACAKYGYRETMVEVAFKAAIEGATP